MISYSFIAKKMALWALLNWQIPFYAELGEVRYFKKTGENFPEYAHTVAWEITKAAGREGLDPYVLGAVAWYESKWLASAEGAAGERGVFQIHPRTRRRFRSLDDPSCGQKPDRCQSEIIRYGAHLLAKYAKHCGSLEGGLSAYNTGRCESEAGKRYVRRIMRIRKRMKGYSNLIQKR